MRSILQTRLGVFATALWFGLGAICFGVGGDSPSRISLFGTVKVNGEPLERGTIYFFLVSESTQPILDGAAIRHGHFSIGESSLLVPGTYEVRVSGLDTVMLPEAQGEGAVLPSDPLPECYNYKSEIRVVIPHGGSRHLAFDLKR